MRGDVARSLISLESGPGGVVAVFRFAAELPVFAGHFPGNPLVPGVYLIEGLRLAAARHLDRELAIAEVRDARFTAPAGPGDALRFEISVEAAGDDRGSWIARARLECEGRQAAKLRLHLRELPG